MDKCSTSSARCHTHSRRRSIVVGIRSRKGYCRKCWPSGSDYPARSHWPLPFDATIWLAALVALAACSGEGFSGEPAASFDAGSEGSEAGSEGSGGSGGSLAGSGGSLADSGGSGGSLTGSGSSGGSLAGSGGSLAGSGGSLAGSGDAGLACSNASLACDSTLCPESCALGCWGAPLNLRWLPCCAASGQCHCLKPSDCL